MTLSYGVRFTGSIEYTASALFSYDALDNTVKLSELQIAVTLYAKCYITGPLNAVFVGILDPPKLVPWIKTLVSPSSCHTSSTSILLNIF